MKIAVLSDSHNSIKFAPFLEIAKNYDAIIQAEFQAEKRHLSRLFAANTTQGIDHEHQMQQKQDF